MPVRGIRRWSRNQDRWTQMFDTVGYLRVEPADYVESPDHADFDITGDIDLRALILSTDYTSITQPFMQKFITSSNNRSYKFRISTAGNLVLVWSVDGTAELTQASSAPSFVDGQAYWVRVTMDVDDGLGNRVLTFYKSSDPLTIDPDLVAWTQISQHTVAGTTSIFLGTGVVRLGSEGSASGLTGRLYWAQFRNGIDGTIVGEPDWRDRDQFVSLQSLTDSYGKTYQWSGAITDWWVLPKQMRLTDFTPPGFELQMTRRRIFRSRTR